MRKNILNALALAIIGIGSMMLSAAPVTAATCTGPAGAGGCSCTSGDGKFTCTGDSCTSSGTGCTATDTQIEP